MALGVEGIRIGTAEVEGGGSGCTVVLAPPDTLGALAVRGSSPGTREAAALGAMGKLTVCHAVVLSGGSAYGLATADGVVRHLEAAGIGYPVGEAVVPIVGGAIVLDRSVADPTRRPDAELGARAAAAATDTDPAVGAVGAGAGASIAKVAGLEHAWRGGQGTAVRSAAGVTVGAVVINNAVGELVDDDGTWLARARVDAEVPRYPLAPRPGRPGDAADGSSDTATFGGPTGNTVIGCVVTDARLTKRDAVRVADLAHGGIVRAVRPAHTELDGDALFCLATGRVDAEVDLVAHLAVEAVAEAARRGPLAAHGRDGLPGLADAGGG